MAVSQIAWCRSLAVIVLTLTTYTCTFHSHVSKNTRPTPPSQHDTFRNTPSALSLIVNLTHCPTELSCGASYTLRSTSHVAVSGPRVAALIIPPEIQSNETLLQTYTNYHPIPPTDRPDVRNALGWVTRYTILKYCNHEIIPKTLDEPEPHDIAFQTIHHLLNTDCRSCQVLQPTAILSVTIYFIIDEPTKYIPEFNPRHDLWRTKTLQEKNSENPLTRRKLPTD